jgi:AAA+ superfamily predicted ATPase
MKEYDIQDYFLKADDHYYTAMNLYSMYIADNFPYHRFDPLSKIANNCELAAELNIKAYMIENKIPFENTHSLVTFLDDCINNDVLFADLKKDVSLLSGYTSKINYPNNIHINNNIIIKTIESTKNILFFEKVLKLRYKYGIQLPLSEGEVRDKIIQDEQNAYIMALESYRAEIGVIISKKNISKINELLKNNLKLLQNIEKEKESILKKALQYNVWKGQSR